MVLVCTPFFINRLGPDQYGIWMLINTTIQLMSVLNLGLGDANIKFISKYVALEDFHAIRKTVTATFSLALIIVLLSFGLGLLLSYLIQYHDWFKLPTNYKMIGIESVRFAFVLFGLKFLEVIVLSIFQGFERYDRSSMFSLLSRVVVLTANVVWVYNGASLIEVFISSVVFQSISRNLFHHQEFFLSIFSSFNGDFSH
jgi:O-antigen/teichoic acid export membrane protein